MGAIPFALPDITQLEIDAVTKALSSGWLTGGQVVIDFEKGFAERVGAKHAVALNSATAAALLILDSLGVGPDDEVIVPAYTFSGPAMMAHRLGAKVVFADCLPGSYQVDYLSVNELITPKTKVIMPTHFGGPSCDMDSLLATADLYQIDVVDDAAHAFPTKDSAGRWVGSQGARATFFSFYATKCLTTGEGGMIVTDDDELAMKCRRLRTHGFNRTVHDRYTNPQASWVYDIASPGWKANMTDLSASLGLAQLERTDSMWLSRVTIASRYKQAFADTPGVKMQPFDHGSAHHLFPIQVPADRRDAFIEAMRDKGVHCSVHFIPLHKHSFWQAYLGDEQPRLPHAEAMFAGTVSLPIYSSLAIDQVSRIIDAVQTTAKEMFECLPA